MSLDSLGDALGELPRGTAAEVMGRAAEWLQAGRRVAIATVVQTWGSAPRPVGSQMAVDETGAMAGSVSGGCIEGAVVHEALKALEDGEPRHLSFGITNERAWEVGLACGGKLDIYLEPVI
jgi:xanthine/CO dehydrogenase XdhC/CoxF family maturation factor